MATRTSTETKWEITRRGNVVTVKEIEKTTTCTPGKEPIVKEVTTIQEYRDPEDYEKLPDCLRQKLHMTNSNKPSGRTLSQTSNKTATPENFAEDCLKEHNKFRALHGADPLNLSPQLIQISQERAHKLAETDQMSTRSDQKYGENVKCLWSSDPNYLVQAGDVVSQWYAQHKNYNFNEEPDNLNSANFTQMVWMGSTEFGVAAAKSNSNRIYVVATYNPPGNCLGQFKQNVRPIHSKGQGSSDVFPDVNTNFPKPEKLVTPVQISGPPILCHLNNEGLAFHNELRRKHGVPLLSYSKELARYAQEWAEELARRDRMEHRNERKYGENLYCFKSTNPLVVATAKQACQSWYSEIKNYNFDSEPRSLSTGHFTQMIWRTTKELGMGWAKSKTGLQLIVANYNPPGNYIGTFRANCPRVQS